MWEVCELGERVPMLRNKQCVCAGLAETIGLASYDDVERLSKNEDKLLETEQRLEDDIRLVYDATTNKLNKCVWAPSCWLPTIDSLVWALDKNSWMTDWDVGDMFLNFQLHRDVVPFTGVDLSSLYDSPEDTGPRWAVWDRNLMGFAASPYNSIKMALIAEEICKGNRFETGVGWDGKEINPFQWKGVHLNLPGTKDYDPCVTWISKRREDGRIAYDVFTFVDDERVVGPDEDLTWQYWGPQV